MSPRAYLNRKPFKSIKIQPGNIGILFNREQHLRCERVRINMALLTRHRQPTNAQWRHAFDHEQSQQLTIFPFLGAPV
jgi:hypothetical protein